MTLGADSPLADYRLSSKEPETDAEFDEGVLAERNGIPDRSSNCLTAPAAGRSVKAGNLATPRGRRGRSSPRGGRPYLRP
jgi:hypothetical protein